MNMLKETLQSLYHSPETVSDILRFSETACAHIDPTIIATGECIFDNLTVPLLSKSINAQLGLVVLRSWSRMYYSSKSHNPTMGYIEKKSRDKEFSILISKGITAVIVRWRNRNIFVVENNSLLGHWTYINGGKLDLYFKEQNIGVLTYKRWGIGEAARISLNGGASYEFDISWPINSLAYDALTYLDSCNSELKHFLIYAIAWYSSTRIADWGG